MFPYGSYSPFYYPIYFYPAGSTQGSVTFQPMMMYPQTVQPRMSIEQPRMISENLNESLPSNRVNITTNNQQNQIVHEISESEESAPKVNQENSTNPKNKSDIKAAKKPKRPLTYLTQRAFYMKQKVRGKLKNDRRILRKRYRPREAKVAKEESKPNQAEKSKQSKVYKKKVVSKVTKSPLNKSTEKIKHKTSWIYVQSLAKIPSLIGSQNDLIQFLEPKKISLFGRKLD